MRRARSAAFLLACASLAPARRGAAAEEPPVAAIPTGVPVGLDGDAVPDEWADAATFPLGASGAVLRAKQQRGTLLLAVQTDRPWPAKGWFMFVSRPGDGEGKAGDPGTVRVDFEPLEHDRPHTIVHRTVGTELRREDERVVVRTAKLAGSATLEAAIPLALLGIEGTAPPPLRWIVQLGDPGRRPSYASFPPGLDLGAGKPPDFETTARWAKTVEWHRADGPGAFSRTDWDAWVAADREMTRRGTTAHAFARALRDDEAADPGAELTKDDDRVETEVVANLSWIAEREPLTSTDLRALATGRWRQNRYDDALALLAADAAGRAGWRSAETAFLRGQVAQDGERFDDAAAAWDFVAERVPNAPPYRDAARRAREAKTALERELAARREDEGADLPLALLRTAKGEIVLRLLEDDVPQAVASFVHLVETKDEAGRGFYDGTLFHRVQPNRFAQGGDPKSRTEGCEKAGDGGPPWHVEAETNARHGFFRGSVGFATKGDRKNRSQFFLVTGHPQADFTARGFTCFGTVVAGQDVADRLETCDVLHSVSILRKRDHPYVPKKR